MGSLSFTHWHFAAAGAVCATAPLIIHLLNRRRFRVIHWAAMDFLRQALQQKRRAIELRDMLLLVVRTLAVLLLGFGLARPYLAGGGARFDERQPIHAVVVIDNSLSMAYESLEGSLLDKAKKAARRLIENLPAGSRISVIAACGSRELPRIDPYTTKEDANEAVDKIGIVDRSLSMSRSCEEVLQVCDQVPELAKRVVFFGDQQALNWRDVRESDDLKRLPPTQIISLAASGWENTSIASLRIQDGLADVETPATIVVEVLNHGGVSTRDVQVTLSVDDVVIGQKAVTLDPRVPAREVSFECLFSSLSQLPEPNQPVFLPLKVAISGDRLPADDERYLIVPIVAGLPVIFVDQYGSDEEDVARGRLGETRHLRKLLAPRASRGDVPRQFADVRHLAPREVTRDALSTARLVVIAGLRDPGPMVDVLREYVVQGGQLFIAAGADFDPIAWNEFAWLEGEGILPLPLKPTLIGRTPEETTETLRPFFLSAESLASEPEFQLAAVGPEEMNELFSEPIFFKAVEVDESRSGGVQERLMRSSTDAQWLTWARHDGFLEESNPPNSANQADAQLLSPAGSRVLGRYELPLKPAFLVARQMGRGGVMFCSTGVLSSWNTLPKTNAMLLLDRALREMMHRTLPKRNIEPTERFVLPIQREAQHSRVMLTRPQGEPFSESVDVGFITAEARGVTLSGLLERGIYRLGGFQQAGPSARIGRERPQWTIPISVNGGSLESDLTPLTPAEFRQITDGADIHWRSGEDEIRLSSAQVRGQSSWRWLVLGVMSLLVFEMLVLAAEKGSRTAVVSQLGPSMKA